jgi:hypothetical protein
MQLDGPDLEELLIRARQEYGSTVRIVAADKIRSGGLGGFFSKENFQLTVEVDGGPDTDPADVPVVTSVTTPAFPPAAGSGFIQSPAFAPSSSLIDVETPSLESLAEDAAAQRPVSLLDLADAISDRETYEPRTRMENPVTPKTAPITGSISTGPAVSTEGATFASILAGLTESVSEPQPAAKVNQAAARYDDDAESFVESRPPLVDQRPRNVEMRKAGRRAGVAVAAEGSRRSLTDLGVPNALLPAGYDGDLLTALVTALKGLPPLPKPPQRPGDVFAVVGEGPGAWDAAVQLAMAMGLDERSVFLVTQGNAPARVPAARRLGSLEQIESKLERWHHKTTATIVVVDAPMTPSAAQWNREVLEVLDPTSVWLVVPATRKTGDVAEWAKRLGPADGLVVTEVAASQDPASVLCLGIPVAWLDGRPATAGAWAGLLVERLVEAA